MDAATSSRPGSAKRSSVRLRHAVTILVLLLGATACDDALDLVMGSEEDAPQAEETAQGSTAEEPTEMESSAEAAPSEVPEEQAEGDAGTGNDRVLPAEFPAAFPLPDEYMIVRMEVGEFEEVGLAMALNIAIDGTVEEWSAFYDEALPAEFNDVHVRDDIQDNPWHFHGHGFDRAVLYVSNNLGIPDMDGNDSSHLPVMLFISFDERETD